MLILNKSVTVLLNFIKYIQKIPTKLSVELQHNVKTTSAEAVPNVWFTRPPPPASSRPMRRYTAHCNAKLE